MFFSLCPFILVHWSVPVDVHLCMSLLPMPGSPVFSFLLTRRQVIVHLLQYLCYITACLCVWVANSNWNKTKTDKHSFSSSWINFSEAFNKYGREGKDALTASPCRTHVLLINQHMGEYLGRLTCTEEPICWWNLSRGSCGRPVSLASQHQSDRKRDTHPVPVSGMTWLDYMSDTTLTILVIKEISASLFSVTYNWSLNRCCFIINTSL